VARADCCERSGTNRFLTAEKTEVNRSSAESGLRRWGLRLRERVSFKRAAVAVARKLAVIMHAMLKTGTFFDRSVGVAA